MTIARITSGAGLGLLCAAAGLATGQAVAAFVAPESAPLLAVGSAVIDAAPTPLKEFAVSTFRTADKLVLLGGVGTVVALVAAAAGIAAVRNARARRIALIVPVLLAVVAGAAALARPTAAPSWALPALLTGIVATASLAWLAAHVEHMSSTAADVPAAPAVGHGRLVDVQGSRRALFAQVGALGVGTAALALVGSKAGGSSNTADVHLPAPATPEAALPAGVNLKVAGITPFVTANADFYRVDTALVVPRVDPKTWQLSLEGMVSSPFTLSFADLLAMPLVERTITLTCVSNEVGGRYAGTARWLGVPLKTLLDRAGIDPKADQLLSRSVDGYTAGTPMAVLNDGREALVAVGMNGSPLPPEHGFPARLVIPGLYGFVSATKWLTALKATTYSSDVAYWTQRGWATDAPIKIASRIDTPAPLGTISPGTVAVAGVAWAQGVGIKTVQVRVDAGPWQDAMLAQVPSVDTWRQWWWPWKATPGRHTLSVRAIDEHGTVQTEQRATPFPAGASGYHEVVVIVNG